MALCQPAHSLRLIHLYFRVMLPVIIIMQYIHTFIIMNTIEGTFAILFQTVLAPQPQQQGTQKSLQMLPGRTTM